MMDTPRDWPFDQGPRVAAITSTHITKQHLPVLLVTHYEDDDSWGFQSGLPVTTADMQIVAMEEIMKIDPSIAEAAKLLPGWSATRKEVGGEWSQYKDQWPDEE
jgi:hypothetical protein